MKTTYTPTLQSFHIEGIKHITPAEAMVALTNHEAVLIDVREENEVLIESVPLDNVLYHPMSVILDRLPHITKNQNIILGCPGGVRSSKVANLLRIQGYPNVANLDGGFTAWKAQGLPFGSILPPADGCGCNCSSCNTADGDVKSSCC